MSNPFRALLVGVALMLGAGSAGAAPADDPLTLYFRAAITIEPDGSLSALDWHDAEKMPATLRARLDERVRSWEFVPGAIDGTPTVTETTLRLRIRASALGEGLVLTVENAETGAAIAPLMPPEYPREALRRRVEAAVLAELDVASDGTRSVSIAGYEGDERTRPKFERAVEGMFANLDIQFERVGGHPAPAHFTVPVNFCLDKTCDDHAWPSRDTAAATAPGQPVARDSVASVATDVKGQAI